MPSARTCPRAAASCKRHEAFALSDRRPAPFSAVRLQNARIVLKVAIRQPHGPLKRRTLLNSRRLCPRRNSRGPMSKPFYHRRGRRIRGVQHHVAAWSPNSPRQSHQSRSRAAASPRVSANPLAGNPDAIQAGGRLFSKACEKCHGPAGEGDPTAAPPLNTVSFIHGYEDARECFRRFAKASRTRRWSRTRSSRTRRRGSWCHSSRAWPVRRRPAATQIGIASAVTVTGRRRVVCRCEGLSLKDIPAHGAVWEKVLRKVRSGEMPPARVRTRPDTETARAFASFLETTLDHEAVVHPNPGPALAHRLNRAEYSNAIRDLLSVDVKPGDWLPVDDSGYGFDNIAAGDSPPRPRCSNAICQPQARSADSRSVIRP